MKNLKKTLIFLFIIFSSINIAFSQIGTGFYDGAIFNTFTNSSTNSSGSLNGNNFTVTYANGGGTAGAYVTANQQQYKPGTMPTNTGFPYSVLPRLIEVRGVSGAHSSPYPTMTWAFTSTLVQFATVYIQDVDVVSSVHESIKVEFLDASGTAISTSNIIVKTSSTSGLPTITTNATDITITGTVAATEPLLGLTIISTNVKSVQVTELQMNTTGTYEIFFGVLGTDHGDAPSGYGDAQHFISTNLGLGSVMPDAEATANYSTNADGDNAAVDTTTINDEDGISSFSTLLYNATSYSVNVSVSNSTGSNATLYGWIDFNRNGVFDAGERSAAVTVANGATSATVSWTGLSSLSIGKTYARFRIAANSSEVTSPTGAALSGEVEDYTLNIIAPVPLTFLGFSAKRNGDDILINWETANETGIGNYEVEYSTDVTNFIKAATVTPNNSVENYYQFTLKDFVQPVYYIRIKWIDIDDHIQYSSVAIVKKESPSQKTMIISPNPVIGNINISLSSDISSTCNISIINTAGTVVYQNKVVLAKGINQVQVPRSSIPSNAVYIIKAAIGNELLTNKIIIAR